MTSNEEPFKALRYVRENTDKQIVGVGLSLGGNMIMKNAAEMEDFPCQAIAAVNNPFDFWLALNLMRGKQYEKHLVNELKKSLILRPHASA